jgi:hypothetical protein
LIFAQVSPLVAASGCRQMLSTIHAVIARAISDLAESVNMFSRHQ